MLELLKRILTALIVFVFVLPISVIGVVFATVGIILGLILKLYDVIKKTKKYNALLEFLFVCYGFAVFLILLPYFIITDN